MGRQRNIIDRAARAMGESADKYGIPAKLGWKSTDGTTVYASAAGGPMHYKVRMGQAGEQRVVAVAHDLGMPDVYDLDILVAFQDGTAVIVDWDRSAPIIPDTSLPCAECGTIGETDCTCVDEFRTIPSTDFTSASPQLGIAVRNPRQIGKLATNKYIMFYLTGSQPYTINARVVNFDGSTYSLGAVSTRTTFLTVVPYVSVINSTTFQIGYWIGTIDGSDNITWSGPINTPTWDTAGVAATFSATSGYALAIKEGQARAIVGTRSGATVTWGSEFELFPSGPSGAAQYFDVLPLSDGLWAVLTHAGSAGDYQAQVAIVSSSGSSYVRFYDSDYGSLGWWGLGDHCTIRRIDSSRILIAYLAFGSFETPPPGWTDHNYFAARIIQFSGGTVTAGAPLILSSDPTLNESPSQTPPLVAVLSSSESWIQVSVFDNALNEYVDKLFKVGMDGTSLSIIGQTCVVPGHGGAYIDEALDHDSDTMLAWSAFSTSTLSYDARFWSLTRTAFEAAIDEGCPSQTQALILTGALYLPDLETEPDPPDSGAILYSYQGVARVVDSNGARDL